ncbi:MAG: DUF6463 family protein [Myxococcota bacterium]
MRNAGAVRLTAGVGVIHLLATLPSVAREAPRVIERGVLGGLAASVPVPAEAEPGLSALFSVMLSVELFVVAGLFAELDHPPPRWVGATFLAGGLAGGVLLPVSGFWLLAALGAWLVRARRPPG